MTQVQEVRYSTATKNFIKKADVKLKQLIKKAIDELKVLPPIGDIKHMQGYNDGRMRKRIGKYRIIYALVCKVIKAWDPDFTKVTAEEKKRIEEIDAEIKKGIYFKEEEVFD